MVKDYGPVVLRDRLYRPEISAGIVTSAAVVAELLQNARTTDSRASVREASGTASAVIVQKCFYDPAQDRTGAPITCVERREQQASRVLNHTADSGVVRVDGIVGSWLVSAGGERVAAGGAYDNARDLRARAASLYQGVREGPNHQAVTTVAALATAEVDIEGVDRELGPRFCSNLIDWLDVHQSAADAEVGRQIIRETATRVDCRLREKQTLGSDASVPGDRDDVRADVDLPVEGVIGPILSQRGVIAEITAREGAELVKMPGPSRVTCRTGSDINVPDPAVLCEGRNDEAPSY